MVAFDTALTRLDEFVTRQLTARNTPGLTLSVTDRQRLLTSRTYGYANVDARRPVTPETLFETGSIGKSFTSIALMQLREQGRFDPQAPITDYLPWFAVRSRYGPIRCHHLLSHTAGLIGGSDFSPDQRNEFWALRETETSAPPGARFHYSNVGYKTLGLALEAITGRPWADVIRDGILAPLGMIATDPSITHETRKRLAEPYRRFYDDRPGHPSQPLVPATWLETDTGDGCVCSTATEMAAYLRMLLNRGQGPVSRLISEESFDLITQPITTRNAALDMPERNYGYGLMTWEQDGHQFLGHSGGMVGYYSQMLGDVTDGLGVFVSINGPGNPSEVAQYALQLLSAALRDEALPDLPPALEPLRVPNAADYAGVYHGQGAAGDLTLVADGDELAIKHAGERIPLEAHSVDVFGTPHPAFDRYLLTAARDEQGRVVELSHGARWFSSATYAGPTEFEQPAEWSAYAGHYRSHNPWGSNFRVVLRKGELRMLWPSEPDGFSPDDVLVPLADGSFRVGEDEGGPQRVRFDTLVNGAAWRAHVSGCEYYRFFTP
jgi:CubicO group peptidase (beta-lactamase class C family)